MATSRGQCKGQGVWPSLPQSCPASCSGSLEEFLPGPLGQWDLHSQEETFVIPTLCPECEDQVWATSSRTMASHCLAVWWSFAVTVKATCSEGICSSRVAKTVPSAPTLKSILLVSYCVPLVPTQLLNLTVRGEEDTVRRAVTNELWVSSEHWAGNGVREGGGNSPEAGKKWRGKWERSPDAHPLSKPTALSADASPPTRLPLPCQPAEFSTQLCCHATPCLPVRPQWMDFSTQES